MSQNKALDAPVVPAGAGLADGPLPAEPRMSRGRFWFTVATIGAALAILCALGNWQVQRLQWKEGLIRTIQARITADPLPFDDVAQRFAETGDVDYTPVRVSGRFLHEGERYFLFSLDGQPGWSVFTPLLLAGGERMVFVNRGFVPYAMRDPATRREGQVGGEVEITGLARNPVPYEPGLFVPENDPASNTFFWRDVEQMAQGLSLPPGVALVPFSVDAGDGRAPGGYPVGGTTVVDVPNNHLQYAVTWYGLALVLFVMSGVFLLRRLRPAKP